MARVPGPNPLTVSDSNLSIALSCWIFSCSALKRRSTLDDRRGGCPRVAAPCLVPARRRLDRRGAWWPRLYYWRRLLLRRAKPERDEPGFGSHKTANPRTLSCATRGAARHALRGCLLHGGMLSARGQPAPAADESMTRGASPPRSSAGRHANRDRAKDGNRRDLRTRGLRARRATARRAHVRRTGFIAWATHNVLDLDACGSIAA